MNFKKSLRHACLFALAAAPLCACTGPAPEGASSKATSGGAASAVKKGGPVIARFDDQTLTADELTAKLNERSPFERARMNTLDRKKEFVEQLVRFDLLADEAKKRGLDQDPEVVRAAQTVMVRKLIQQEIDENPEKKKFSDDELKAYYQAHLEDFVRPEMVRLSAIVLQAKDLAEAKKRKGEAEAILKDLQAHANDYSYFGAMVARKSEDAATKQTQGDLRFLSKQQLADKYGPEVAEAGFAIPQQGTLSQPVVTAKGVYLFKLMGRTPAVNQTFEVAKPMLTQRLWYEKRSKLFDQFIDDLKKKSNYSLDEAALDKLQVSATAPTNFAGVQMPGTPMAPVQAVNRGMNPRPVQAGEQQPAQGGK